MNISVIVATWNNAKRLGITLVAMGQCHIPVGISWELVVVNNNCTDDTDSVIKEFSSKLPIVYVKEPIQGLSRARNAGLKAASGELIIFTDDDIKPCKEWFQSYWSAFQMKKEGYYFGGSVESEFEISKPEPDLLRWAPPSIKGLELGMEERELSPVEMFVSANWACPRYALEKTGYFDISKGLNATLGQVKVGEEEDLMNRLKKIGLKSYYLPQPRIAHFVPANKCTLRHIVLRAEAGSANYILKEIQNSNRIRFLGIPRWIYKDIFVSYFISLKNLISAKLSGRKATLEYISYRGVIGRIRGVLEWVMNPKRATSK